MDIDHVVDSPRVCFIDTETTGLNTYQHSIWEVALILGSREYLWQFPVDEMTADPFALDIGKYWDRRWDPDRANITYSTALYQAYDVEKSRPRGRGKAIRPNKEWAEHFRDLTAGLHIVGAIPSFDEERLRVLLYANGVLPRWHYHIIDVEALMVGWLSAHSSVDIPLPWKSEDLSRAVGVDPDLFDKHTALGDARWAKTVFDKIITYREEI